MLMYRVCKAMRVYARTRKTEREVQNLIENLNTDLTSEESNASFSAKAEQILVATRQRVHGLYGHYIRLIVF